MTGGPGGSPTARRLAADVLVRIEEGAYANLALPPALAASGLSRQDRGFVTELVYGTTRMRRACDWLVEAHVRGPVQPEIKALLRLGAYQLAFAGTPAHAAVSATVEEAPPRARGLVNAVLRRVATALPPTWPDLATELSYPDWVVDRLCADLGHDTARAALTQMDEAPPVSTRADGYVQDQASQWVAALARASAGHWVVDVCAAPGGKATALAAGARRQAPGGELEAVSSGGDSAAAGCPALVVAADLRPGRAAMVAANASRLDLRNLATIVADGRRLPLVPGRWDRVLVDAPCSGLGVLRRRPDARWRIQAADVPRLGQLQRQLLGSAVPLLNQGGVLAYSVCTMTGAETLDVDAWMAEHHPGLVALPPPASPWVPWGRGALLLPQAAGTDGMYLLLLSRS